MKTKLRPPGRKYIRHGMSHLWLESWQFAGQQPAKEIKSLTVPGTLMVALAAPEGFGEDAGVMSSSTWGSVAAVGQVLVGIRYSP